MFNAVNCQGGRVEEGSVGQERASPAKVHARFHAIQVQPASTRRHMHLYKRVHKRDATETNTLNLPLRLCSQR